MIRWNEWIYVNIETLEILSSRWWRTKGIIVQCTLTPCGNKKTTLKNLSQSRPWLRSINRIFNLFDQMCECQNLYFHLTFDEVNWRWINLDLSLHYYYYYYYYDYRFKALQANEIPWFFIKNINNPKSLRHGFSNILIFCTRACKVKK